MNTLVTRASLLICFIVLLSSVWGEGGKEKEAGDATKVEENVGGAKTNGGTSDDTVKKEEEAIKIDGLNVAQIKELREKSEKFAFQAEVNRMMSLIINSLYKNKEIFLRELISNASDALDKIRFLSLTDPNALAANPDMWIRIKADTEDNTLHISDTGIGMTKEDLLKNLGTIAKSGTSDFISKISKSESSTETSDLIGQFGVGFYSSFLVAKRVTVITKNNNDDQYIWESDAESFSVIKDPRGNTLKRGTEIILHMKDETKEYLEPSQLKELVSKYSQFINFPIYLWQSKTEMVDAEPEPAKEDETEKKTEEKKDEDATVEEEKEKTEEKKPKQVEKTTWNWELVNDNKPIWTRKPADVKDEEYNSFYKAFTNDNQDPLGKIHFKAEGEVTFNTMMFIPKTGPSDMFRQMVKHHNIKLYVRRVFITDSFEDFMPNYFNFIKGIVDSDDLPLNVSRETLQQSKLLNVIKKKMVRKVIEMISKLNEKDFEAFWKEYSTNIKLGVTEDNSNRTKLSKLLRFWSSNSDEKMTSLADYVKRMKTTQKNIFFIAGENKDVLKKSPLVERLLKRGYEVIYCIDPIDEYTFNAMNEFDSKKIQNLAKEGLELEEDANSKAKKEALTKEYEPLFDWLKTVALKDKIEKAVLSDRLSDSPCALVATQWGYSGNMERMMRSQAYKKSNDPQTSMLDNQKRILELNARHPLIKELKARMDTQKEDDTTLNMAHVLYDAAVLRSGFNLPNTADFAARIEKMMRVGLNIPVDEKVEEEVFEEAPVADENASKPADDEPVDAKPVKTDEDVESETTDAKTEL